MEHFDHVIDSDNITIVWINLRITYSLRILPFVVPVVGYKSDARLGCLPIGSSLVLSGMGIECILIIESSGFLGSIFEVTVSTEWIVSIWSS